MQQLPAWRPSCWLLLLTAQQPTPSPGWDSNSSSGYSHSTTQSVQIRAAVVNKHCSAQPANTLASTLPCIWQHGPPCTSVQPPCRQESCQEVRVVLPAAVYAKLTCSVCGSSGGTCAGFLVSGSSSTNENRAAKLGSGACGACINQHTAGITQLLGVLRCEPLRAQADMPGLEAMRFQQACAVCVDQCLSVAAVASRCRWHCLHPVCYVDVM